MFGSNHLYIGEGISDILTYIENLYNIDFNDLENKRIEKRKKVLTRIQKKLNEGKAVKISSGKKIIGIDIPAGDYLFKNVKNGDNGLALVDVYDENRKFIHIIYLEDEERFSLKEGYMIESEDECLIVKA